MTGVFSTVLDILDRVRFVDLVTDRMFYLTSHNQSLIGSLAVRMSSPFGENPPV